MVPKARIPLKGFWLRYFYRAPIPSSSIVWAPTPCLFFSQCLLGTGSLMSRSRLSFSLSTYVYLTCLHSPSQRSTPLIVRKGGDDRSSCFMLWGGVVQRSVGSREGDLLWGRLLEPVLFDRQYTSEAPWKGPDGPVRVEELRERKTLRPIPYKQNRWPFPEKST